jgi:hypothetical protein
MRVARAHLWAIPAFMLAVVSVVGCLGAREGEDDAVGDPSLNGDIAFRPHRRIQGINGAAGIAGGPTGIGGGTAGTTGAEGNIATPGVAVGCDVCAKAQQCCSVVTGQGPLCTFSATTCAAMIPVARDAYVRRCLSFLDTTATAMSTPPPECR